MHLKRDHLARVGSGKTGRVISEVVNAATPVLTAVGWGALTGYRAEKSATEKKIAEKDIMPHVGPVPADILVGGAAMIGAAFLPGMYGRLASGVGVGSIAFFGATWGQDMGRKLAKPKTKGAAAVANPAYRRMLEETRASMAAQAAASPVASPVERPAWAR